MSSRIRLLLKLALLAGGLLLIVLGVAVALLFAQTSAIASQVASRVLPRLSKEVGYEIRIGALEGRILPRPCVDVTELVVSGAAGEPPLLAAQRVRANVMLWPLIRSLGQEARFSSVTVEGARLSVVTRRDGSSNLGKLVSYWGRRAHSKPTWELDSATLRSSRLALFDLGQNSEARIQVEAFEADFKPEGARAALELRGQMAAGQPNVSAKLAINGSVVSGTFDATGVELARVRGALPGHCAELVSGGLVSTQGRIATDARGLWVIKGSGKGQRLLFGKEVVEAAFELSTTIDLGPSPPAPIELASLTADRFVVGLIELKELRGQATATRDAFRVVGLTGKLAGGSVNVAEARLEFSTKELPWTLRAATEKLEMTQLGRTLGIKMPVTGKASSSFDAKAAGLKWETMRPTLVATGRFNVEQAMVSAETSAMLSRSIRNTLNTFAMGGLFPELGAMAVAPFGASYQVQDGVLRLNDPVAFRTQIGDAVLKGAIGLDQKLALMGSATLRWTPLAGMKAHAATVPIAIRGTLSNPTLEVTATPSQLLGAIAGAAPTLSEIEAEAKRRLKTWLGGK